MFTRLLDWSESLLVAGYFAVEDARNREWPPMIYCVRDIPLAPTDKHDKLDELDEVMLYYPPHISPRIPAQTGLFTVHKNPDKPFIPNKVYLRIEIETALQRVIPVIPVLAQGASMPREKDLPPSLQPFAYRNAIAVCPDPDFRADMDRLIKGIQTHLGISR
jgi:hypothetical protein